MVRNRASHRIDGASVRAGGVGGDRVAYCGVGGEHSGMSVRGTIAHCHRRPSMRWACASPPRPHNHRPPVAAKSRADDPRCRSLVNSPVTRSKDLRRIEQAIEHRDKTELRWAAEYCRLRLQHIRVLDRGSESRWRTLEKRIREALGEE